MAADLRALGVRRVADPKRRDPERLYAQLNRLRGTRQDPCILYAFRCAAYAARTAGRRREPGGWNRFQLQVADLGAMVDSPPAAGVRFRSDLIRGIGGNQVLLEDSSGNPIEPFEPARRP